jgi:hypothetical protein
MKRRFLPIRVIRVIRGCFSQGQKLPGRWWRAEDRALGSSKSHSHPAKKCIRPVCMFGHMGGNRILDVLIAWNEPDPRSDGKIGPKISSCIAGESQDSMTAAVTGGNRYE